MSGVDFREDGAAALEWAAQYLERVGDLPVLAQVEAIRLTVDLQHRSRLERADDHAPDVDVARRPLADPPAG